MSANASGNLEDVLGAEIIKTNKISPTGVSFNILEPNELDYENAKLRYDEKLLAIEAEKKREEETKILLFKQQSQSLTFYLNRYKSPMASYSGLILNTCLPYGIHFCKFYLSIAAIESGFGRVPIGCCNAHGIVGVKYANWEDSILKSTSFVLNGYYLKGVDTFQELAYSSYGPKNPEEWIKNLYQYYYEMSFLD